MNLTETLIAIQADMPQPEIAGHAGALVKELQRCVDMGAPISQAAIIETVNHFMAEHFARTLGALRIYLESLRN